MTHHPLGETRTRVCRDHAIIGTDSYVSSPLFGWTNTSGVILISPAMASATAAGATRGPGFAMYLAMMTADSSTNGGRRRNAAMRLRFGRRSDPGWQTACQRIVRLLARRC